MNPALPVRYTLRAKLAWLWRFVTPWVVRKPRALHAFMDWHACKHCGKNSGTGLVRMYELDGTEPHSSYGEPLLNWEWSCVANHMGDTVGIELALVKPPAGGLEELARLAESEGFEYWGWARTDKKGERPRLFKIRRA